MNGMTSRPSPRVLLTTLIVLVGGVALAPAQPEEGSWTFLPNDDMGTRAFRAEHPTFDGRGVVIAILDTGVDAFAPGLERTSQGGVKLIEARDFSGQGSWEVATAELDSGSAVAEPVFRHPDGLALRGAAALPVPPPADDLVRSPVYMGVIAESQFLNSIGDLDDDGDRGGRFGFLAWLADRAAAEAALGVGRGLEMLAGLNDEAAAAIARERQSERVWLVAVDTDGDGDLANERVLRDYHVDYDTFRLTDRSAPAARTLMAWSVTVLEERGPSGAPAPPRVEFHFDDGAHGSHCAGIAAGFEVSGQAGMDGVAPGAWLLSCKIGDNRLSGGASTTESMRKAYEFAAAFGERYGLPVVVNMSYGIASVEEGEDRLGGWLDGFLAEHPGFYVCTSAGNEGPGLSTIGIPATAASLISSGAYMSVDAARDLYETRMPRPQLFDFSSRGGETAKPDVVAPGGCLSTVPGHVDGMARFNGTSMASPHTAGAVACLLSGAAQEGLAVQWGMVKRALIAGATRIPHLALDDQGGGLVTMLPTWDLLVQLARSGSAHDILWYRIETPCVFQADGLADAAYWRTPGGTPLAPETVTFTVHPIFHPDLSPDEKDTFFRSFSLRSEADWLEVVPGKRYIRGDMGMTVEVRYDGRRLREPGLHAARVVGSLDGGDLSGLAGREFYLWNTVVVGEPAGPETGYLKVFEGRDLPPLGFRRHYVEVPAGASAMRVRLEASERTGASRGTMVRAEICDPQGVVRGGYRGYATRGETEVLDYTVLPPELYPGVWEVVATASRFAEDLSSYRLTVAFDGYACEPAAVTALDRPGTGKPARADLRVTRLFRGVFRGDVTAAVEGFARERAITIEDDDTWSYAFRLDRQNPRAEFTLTMDEKTGNLFTDCAVNILDGDGRAVDATGFNGLEAGVSVRLPDGQDSAGYTLEVQGGFAIAADRASWGFDLEERYLLAGPVAGLVARAGGGAPDLHAGVPVDLEVSFAESWPEPPEGLSPCGTIRFLDRHPDDRVPGERGTRLVLEVPIRLE